MKALLIYLIMLSCAVIMSSSFQLVDAESEIKILGTSSLHDWESTVNDFSVSGKIDNDQITELKVSVKGKSIKSGKSIMDSKTYDALQVNKFPTITLQSDALRINGKKITGQAILSIAGESRSVNLDAGVVEKDNSFIKIKGDLKLKMTDFNIEPPTAMFGSLLTGDEVTIAYNIKLKL